MIETSENLIVTIPEFFNIVTTINLVIMFGILVFKKQNSLPNIILAFIFLLPSLNYINNYLILSGKLHLFPSVVFLSQIGAFICTALVYQYSRIFMGKRLVLNNFLHAATVFAILYCAYHLVRFLKFDTNGKDQFINNIIEASYPDYIIRCRAAFFLLLNGYFLLMAYQTWKHTRNLLNINSDLELIKLRYLQKFVILIWLLNIGILISYLILPNFYVDFIAVPVITNIFYIFILKSGFNHTAIFKESEYINFERRFREINDIKSSKSTIKQFEPDEIDQINIKINQLINLDKAFTDQEINIIRFSKLLGLTVHQTSYFINTYMKTNFYNLINSKRIELAKEKLDARGEKSEIEIIGYESGFNSKSAFYRAFKKYVSLSPTEYIKSN